MRKFMFAVIALATLGAAAVTPAEANVPVNGPAVHRIVTNHPRCDGVFVNNGCILGIVVHCVKWKELNGKPPFVCAGYAPGPQ